MGRLVGMPPAPLPTPIHDDWPALDKTLRQLVSYARLTRLPYELVEPVGAAGVCLRLDGGRLVVQFAAPWFFVDDVAATRKRFFAEARTAGQLYLAADLYSHIAGRAGEYLEVAP